MERNCLFVHKMTNEMSGIEWGVSVHEYDYNHNHVFA
jgi:hypothetical protein